MFSFPAYPLSDAFLTGPFNFTIEGERWSIDGFDALEMGILLRGPRELFDEFDHHVLPWGDA